MVTLYEDPVAYEAAIPYELAAGGGGGGGGSTPVGPGSQGGGPRQSLKAEWRIDGKSVPLEWTTASRVANGGYDSLPGVRVPMRYMPDAAGEFSTIEGIRTDGGGYVYHGRISATPRVREGMAIFDGEGFKEVLARQQALLLYQDRDGTRWQQATSPPYNYTAEDSGYGVNSKAGELRLVVARDQPMATDAKAGALYWAQNSLVTRVAFTLNKNRDNNDFEIRLYRMTGPSGTRTLLTQWAMTSANPSGTLVDYAIASPTDMVELALASKNGDITVKPNGTQTTNQTGPAIDVGDATAADLTLDISASTGSIDVDIQTAPDGTNWRTVASFPTQSTNSKTTISVPGISNKIRYKTTLSGGGGSPSFTFKIDGSLGYSHIGAWLTDIRANGITLLDTLSASDLAIDVFARAGFDTSRVVSSSTNALPRVWRGPRDGLLDEMTDLDDWVWQVVEPSGSADAGGTFGPWGPTYTAALERGASDSLAILPLYNRATITYQTPDGVEQEVSIDADPDPFASRSSGVVNEWIESLSDPQSNDSLATIVGTNRIARLSKVEAAGTLHLSEAAGSDGTHPPWDVVAGSMLDLRDLEVFPYGAAPSQRVISSTVNVDGTVDVDISADMTLSGLIARAEPHHHHHDPRRRHHRKHGKGHR